MKRQILLFLILFSGLNMLGQDLFLKDVDKDFLMGKIEYQNDIRFVEVSKDYSVRGVYLNPTTSEAFIKMANAAKAEGIDLQIISGTRSFEEQKRIWEKKYLDLQDISLGERVKKILEFSAMPATSRHHWGTDLDINSVEESYFETDKGKAEYQWLVKNAGKFGFYQVYTNPVLGRTGYSEEKWHWSYMPLANFFLRAYNEQITYSDIEGFEGASLAEDGFILENYVNGISHSATPTALAIQNVQKRSFDHLKNQPPLKVD